MSKEPINVSLFLIVEELPIMNLFILNSPLEVCLEFCNVHGSTFIKNVQIYDWTSGIHIMTMCRTTQDFLTKSK